MLKLTLLVLLALLVTPAFSAPQIFWASDPVRPGEAALLVGDGFGEHPRIELTRLQDDPGGVPGPVAWTGTGTVVEPLQPSDQSVKFLVPAHFKNGVYAVRIANKDKAAVELLNAPTVYWAQGDQGPSAAPGGWIRIFGRCIGQTPATAVLRMTSATTQTARRLTATASNDWEARFVVPADLKPGVYDLHLHNGSGDSSAWTPVGSLEIKTAEPWPDRQFNVRDFGATGTGTTDDTQAVMAALQAAGDQGGGVVFFPRGRYLLTEALILPRFVTLRGEHRDLVNILWPDMEQPPLALIQGSNHFALEDLTLYASRYRHLIAGDLQTTPNGEPGYVRIQRVTARADIYRGHLKPAAVDQRFRDSLKLSSGGGDTLRLGGEHLVITDNDLYGSGRALHLSKPRGAYVVNNHFYNGRKGWYVLVGSDGVIFEDNQITGADLMSTGGAIASYGVAYSQNVFYARNKLSLMHGWDREAMTSDAGYGFYYGPIHEATSTTIKLAVTPVGDPMKMDGWKGAGVFILGGKGMGQFARVDHLDGDVVHLDHPWKVLPDESSVITITMLQRHYLFIANEFSDAGVALQYYGTSINHVAVGNQSIRTAGFYNSGRWYRHYQPSWYCQFFDNRILEGNVYRGGANNALLSGEAFLGTLGLQKPPNTAPLALGAIHRRNHLLSNAHLKIVGGGDPAAPGTRDVILENNIVENSDIGLSIDSGVVGVLEHGNVFKQVKEPIKAPAGVMHRVSEGN